MISGYSYHHETFQTGNVSVIMVLNTLWQHPAVGCRARFARTNYLLCYFSYSKYGFHLCITVVLIFILHYSFLKL